MAGSALVAPSEVQDLLLCGRQPALGGDAAEPVRQLAVVRARAFRPPIPIGGDLLQCRRVFI